jgi:hypothetical protein
MLAPSERVVGLWRTLSEPHNDSVGFRIDIGHHGDLVALVLLIFLINANGVDPQYPFSSAVSQSYKGFVAVFGHLDASISNAYGEFGFWRSPLI